MESLQHVTADGCEFCEEIAGQPPKLLGLPSILSTRILKATETGDLLAIPDASPISNRHGLIIPRTHISRFSQFDCGRLVPIVEKAVASLAASETLVFFEHGGHSCLRNGVCSEHAHLHLVVVDGFSMTRFNNALSQLGGEVSDSYSNIRHVFHSELHPDSSDYLVFGIANRVAIDIRIVKFDYVPSQVLRYVLADSLGISPHIESLDTRAEAFLASYRWLAQLLPVGASRVIYDANCSLVHTTNVAAQKRPNQSFYRTCAKSRAGR